MSNNEKKITINCGDGVVMTLLTVFIVLKLAGVITWSWWWVLAPLWIGLGFLLLTVISVCLWGVLATFLKWGP